MANRKRQTLAEEELPFDELPDLDDEILEELNKITEDYDEHL